MFTGSLVKWQLILYGVAVNPVNLQDPPIRSIPTAPPKEAEKEVGQDELTDNTTQTENSTYDMAGAKHNNAKQGEKGHKDEEGGGKEGGEVDEAGKVVASDKSENKSGSSENVAVDESEVDERMQVGNDSVSKEHQWKQMEEEGQTDDKDEKSDGEENESWLPKWLSGGSHQVYQCVVRACRLH